MKAQMRQNPFDVIALDSAEEQGPQTACCVGGLVREDAGELSACVPELGEQGTEFGMNRDSAPAIPLLMDEPFPAGEVDPVQGEACFGKANAVPDGDFKAGRHPSVFNREMCFLGRDSLSNDLLLLRCDFGFLFVRGSFQHEPVKRVGRDEPTLNGFAQDATQELHFDHSSLNLGPIHMPSVLLSPFEVFHGESVGHTLRTGDVLSSPEGADVTPVHEGGPQAEPLFRFGEDRAEPAFNPGVPVGLLVIVGGARFVSSSEPRQVEGLFPSERIGATLFAALHVTTLSGAHPNPPEGGAASLVNAEGHAWGVTECNEGSRPNRQAQLEHTHAISLNASLYFAADPLIESGSGAEQGVSVTM